MPKPASWDNHKLSESARQSIIVRALSTAIFDPSIQESTSDVLRYLDARLHLFHQYCEANHINKPSEIDRLPAELKMLTKDNSLLPDILKLFHWMRMRPVEQSPRFSRSEPNGHHSRGKRSRKGAPVQPRGFKALSHAIKLPNKRVYADEVEQARMKICHPHCIEILNQFLARIESHGRYRALDVAGGDGRLTEHFLSHQYPRVDLFDQDPDVIKKVKRELEKNVSFGYARAATIEDFEWEFSYSAIYMVWVSGYLNDTALAAFLRKAKTQLMTPQPSKRR